MNRVEAEYWIKKSLRSGLNKASELLFTLIATTQMKIGISLCKTITTLQLKKTEKYLSKTLLSLLHLLSKTTSEKALKNALENSLKVKLM